MLRGKTITVPSRLAPLDDRERSIGCCDNMTTALRETAISIKGNELVLPMRFGGHGAPLRVCPWCGNPVYLQRQMAVEGEETHD